MKYELFEELEQLVVEKLVSKRQHPRLPLFIYNYRILGQFKSIGEWTPALRDARGLVLDAQGEIIARAFSKFWNYEQVLDRIPVGEDFTVWEKLDGSLGIVFWYADSLVCATRGSFESDQARWGQNHLKDASLFKPGLTYLTEILYPENRIVVDYGDRRDMPLLAVMRPDGTEDLAAFEQWPASKALRFDGIADFATVNSDPRFTGQEGFVVRWSSGFRAKIKAEEYTRLHRLITQVSTRTIWELLRTGKGVAEVVDRVPEDFKGWVTAQVESLNEAFESTSQAAMNTFLEDPGRFPTRKDFAEWAKQQTNPSLLFSLLDGRSIDDAVWKLVEPRWATPFRKEAE